MITGTLPATGAPVVVDSLLNAPDETYPVGTPSELTATAIAVLVGAAYVPPFSAKGAPVFRGLYSVAGGVVTVSTAYQASKTITLQPVTWWVERAGFTAIHAGGAITDLVVGF